VITEATHPARRFPGSIRLRLTLWYTALLAIVLLGAMLALSTILERQLRNDLDDRLLSTAEQVAAAVQVDPNATDLSQVDVELDLDPFVFPGLVTQIVDLAGAVVDSSGNADTVVLPAAELAQNATSPVFRTAQMGDVDLRTVRYPLRLGTADQAHVAGSVIVGESFLPLDQTLSRLRKLLIASAIVGTTLAAAGGWALAGRALRPVDNVTATAAGIAAGANPASSLQTRLVVPPTRDEVARLATTFNAMLDRLEESFSAQRRFIADASHELRTPLTAMRTNVDVMIEEAADEATPLDRAEILGTLDGVRRSSSRMARLLDDLLLLARMDAPGGLATIEPRRRPLRLDSEVQEAIAAAEVLIANHQLVVTTEPVRIEADPDRLHQLVLILLENAVRYTPPGGRIEIEVGPTPTNTAHLIVRDSGIGIDPTHLPRIFDRFYRTDDARARATGGAGLGLAIAKAIVDAHSGHITATSTPAAGTTFTVTLPAMTSNGATSIENA
jgi:two-component system OmpR family sensor kinase